MKQICSLFLCFVILFGAIGSPIWEGTTVQAETSTRVQELLDSMTLRQKITQMMMVDFRNWNGSGFTVMNDQVRTIVEEYDFGAVIYFAQNLVDTVQAYTLTMEMQQAATKDGGIPMIITADQEGGSVYRLATGTALPGNMALGAATDTVYAEMAGKIIGSELAAIGINSTLAPVVDVNNNANNPVIGLRSYSDDPTLVGEMASATIDGLTQYGVIGCAKHFPGHGDTATDSHYGLPSVGKSLSTLQNCELKPYEIAIEQGIDMIMTAHILYPQLESDTAYSEKTKQQESLPATMSDDIITGLLKGEMGFEGIVTTDAMNMSAIANTWNQTQAAVQAVSAGVDMICMPCTLDGQSALSNLEAIIAALETAVNNNTIPLSRINDAVTRILTVKEKNGVLDWNAQQYSAQKADAVVGSDFNRQVEREIAAASVTVVQNKNNTLPLTLTANSKVLMLVPYDNETAQMAMGWNRAKEAGLIPDGAQVRVKRFSDAALSKVQSDIDWADTVIINSEISSASRMGSNHWLYAGPKTFVEYAEGAGKTTVVQSVDKPYDVQGYSSADAVLAVYGCKGSSADVTEALVGGATTSQEAYGPNIIAGVEVALGVFGATGKLPVDIPKLEGSSFGSQLVFQRGYGLTYNGLHTHVPQLIEATPSTDLTPGYAKDFYECTGCGMWFADSDATEVIVDKYSMLGDPIPSPDNPEDPPLEDPDDTPSENEPDSTPSDTPPDPSVVYGDINVDGKVNAADALLVLKHAVGKEPFTQTQEIAGEVSGDGKINATDALYILQYAVGSREQFPVEEA